jgi:hypothetical protein
MAKGDELDVALSPARARLIATVPALRARSLMILFDTQPRLSEALHQAYPDQLDLVPAAAAIGSFLGAMTSAGMIAQHRGDPPEQVLAAGRQAVEIVARGLDRTVAPDPAVPAREA